MVNSVPGTILVNRKLRTPGRYRLLVKATTQDGAYTQTTVVVRVVKRAGERLKWVLGFQSVTIMSTPVARWMALQINTLTLWLPRVINVKFLLQPYEKYCITQYEELGLVSLTQYLKEHYTTNSHYITYALLFKRSGECTFWTWEWKG